MWQVAGSRAMRAFVSVDGGVQGAHAEDTRAGPLQPRMGQDVSGQGCCSSRGSIQFPHLEHMMIYRSDLSTADHLVPQLSLVVERLWRICI